MLASETKNWKQDLLLLSSVRKYLQSLPSYTSATGELARCPPFSSSKTIQRASVAEGTMQICNLECQHGLANSVLSRGQESRLLMLPISRVLISNSIFSDISCWRLGDEFPRPTSGAFLPGGLHADCSMFHPMKCSWSVSTISEYTISKGPCLGHTSYSKKWLQGETIQQSTFYRMWQPTITH